MAGDKEGDQVPEKAQRAKLFFQPPKEAWGPKARVKSAIERKHAKSETKNDG
jgi:hypothetical protein